MKKRIQQEFHSQLGELQKAGLIKNERILSSAQGPEITLQSGQKVLNFCANNYLGLSNHPLLIQAAHEALDRWGYGLSSVRFICGTQTIHKELEQKVSDFLRTDDTILYAACFDANGGVFEPFMSKDCAIITDALNHASLIDGIRLTKARRLIYNHGDMEDMEDALRQTHSAKYRLIVTDGVFSMDGDIANLKTICDLADTYHALVLVDDSHATGFIGKTGRGTHEQCDVMGRVDLITTTFGKALGGASGGCVSGRKEMIDWLRQKSRPYLFSNSLAPMITATTIAALDMLTKETQLHDTLEKNTQYFRRNMTDAGFDIKPGIHPIVPIMLYKETMAIQMSDKLLKEGIYVIGFSFPVVPRGHARIRVQISAAHKKNHLDKAISAFVKIGKELKILK